MGHRNVTHAGMCTFISLLLLFFYLRSRRNAPCFSNDNHFSVERKMQRFHKEADLCNRVCIFFRKDRFTQCTLQTKEEWEVLYREQTTLRLSLIKSSFFPYVKIPEFKGMSYGFIYYAYSKKVLYIHTCVVMDAQTLREKSDKYYKLLSLKRILRLSFCRTTIIRL